LKLLKRSGGIMSQSRLPIPAFPSHASRFAALAVLAVAGALFAAPAALTAQQARRDGVPAYRYRLIGVYGETSGSPLDSVRVTDVLNGTSILTSPTGTATLVFLPDGGGLVRLQKIGYDVKTLMITIDAADTTPVTVMLSRVTTLPTVVVRDSATPYLSPALRGFERRKQLGLGHYIDEAELRKHDNWTMSNLLTSRVAGLMPVSARGRGAQYVASSRTMCGGLALARCQTANCYPDVYMDGVRYTEGGPNSNAIDFSKWSPTQFAAVEFYNSLEVPAELGGPTAKCGVVMLWTRER